MKNDTGYGIHTVNRTIFLGGKRMSYQDSRNQQSNTPQMVSLVDPYVYQALQTLVSKRVVVETSRGSITGQISDVKPDHIVLQSHDATFFIRIQEIIWVMPQ